MACDFAKVVAQLRERHNFSPSLFLRNTKRSLLCKAGRVEQFRLGYSITS